MPDAAVYRSRRLLTLAVALAFALVLVTVRALVVVPVVIAGHSMEPTVRNGEIVGVWRLVDVAHDVRRGDLVVFRDPEGALSLKRVVGLPGDRVAIRDAVLEVNERVVDEPYVDPTRITGMYFGPVTVQVRTLFVMGDNRSRSTDSREYGAVDAGRVVGRVLLRR